MDLTDSPKEGHQLLVGLDLGPAPTLPRRLLGGSWLGQLHDDLRLRLGLRLRLKLLSWR
jgi:hypothetical protein